MKNKAFSKLSIPEKEAKISSVLDSKTNGLLHAAELQRIAEALPLRQQYTVKLYRSNADYWHVLSLDRSIRIRPVLTPSSPGGASAVVTWSVKDPVGTRQLHIFIPPSRGKKGTRIYEQKRMEAAHGL
jgi:hypothetical protein